MSTVKQALGPWHVFSVYAQHEVRTPTDTLVAVVNSQEHARLIATTPDMLEKLEQALEFVADHEDVIDGDNGPLPNRAMTLAAELRAVIAKATGSAS